MLFVAIARDMTSVSFHKDILLEAKYMYRNICKGTKLDNET